jgi:myo-inositol 2-dehydrogenase/D-chiro-inositol 1-dehydrogenase
MGVRYAIVGAGMMGQEHIRNIALLPQAELVALAEPDPAMRDAAQALAPQARAFTRHEDLLAAGLPFDAVVLASPNHTHAAILEDLIGAGRPILAEKPVVVDLGEAARIEERAARAGVPIWVAMEYRYMPAVSTLIEDLAAGRAGRLRMISIVERRFPFLRKVGDWNRFNRYTGGTLVEKCCHFFDLMRLLARAEPVSIHAIGGQALNHLDESYAEGVPDVLDHAYVTVTFADGVKAMLELCMFAEGSRFQERVSAIGERATLEARVPGPGRFEADGRDKEAEYAIADRATRIETTTLAPVDPALLAAGDHHGSTFHQHRLFNAMVREGGAPAVTLRDGILAVAMGLAAQESIATGRPVAMADVLGRAGLS